MFFLNVNLAKARRRKEIDSKLCDSAPLREKKTLNLMTLGASASLVNATDVDKEG
jgi:hypothetical protein